MKTKELKFKANIFVTVPIDYEVTGTESIEVDRLGLFNEGTLVTEDFDEIDIVERPNTEEQV